jgi:hypothetical protein
MCKYGIKVYHINQKLKIENGKEILSNRDIQNRSWGCHWHNILQDSDESIF